MFFIDYLDSGEGEEPDMNNICRTASAAILVMVYLSVPSFGQDYSRTSGFYGFVGVGSSTDRADAVMHYGVGFETLLEGGFGVGLDLVAFARSQQFGGRRCVFSWRIICLQQGGKNKAICNRWVFRLYCG